MSEDLWSLHAPVDAELAAPQALTGSVTLIIPTFNEAGNVGELLRRLGEALPDHLPCEVLFVDDSTDDTPAVIEKAAADHPFPVSVLHREVAVGGLGGAVVEGVKRADTDWIVVMDADLQHPPHLVPNSSARASARARTSSWPPATSVAAAGPGSPGATASPSPVVRPG
ncbi:glycosyltransferase family 2 protein [Streptomyces sp. MS1.HAVA.3]|uniref:Glycosyltransferase family 2 protein n=1 Tax=Streptomyces caledonius TaxID=3134107 RepID=A0ABU8U5X0_9ACTN